MKLIYCAWCSDVRKLHKGKIQCQCRRTWGKYLEDGLNAVVSNNAVVIGIANPDITEAMREPSHRTLRCWVMGKDAPHVRWEGR